MNLLSNLYDKVFGNSTHDECEKSVIEVLSEYDFSSIKEPEISGNTESDEVLLIVDDIEISKILYESDFNNIKTNSEKTNKPLNVYERYKIVHCLGYGCSLSAYKYICIDKNPLSKCILDITLGESFKTDKGEYIELNGIDLANCIWSIDPNVGIKFLTAHTMDTSNKTVKKYMDLFNIYTKMNIMDYTINKNSTNRTNKLYEFLR